MLSPIHRRGTSRALAPEETWRRIEPLLERCGVTRLADLTELDTAGLPVWCAVRPNGKTLSVALGKGCTPLDARISAAMEALEAASAESGSLPRHLTSLACLRAEGTGFVDPTSLCPTVVLAPQGEIEWLAGSRLADGRSTWVARAQVELDYTRPAPLDGWRQDSTGLAAGNNRVEAAIHALCEVIERDALARCADGEDRRLPIDLDTVRSPQARATIDLLRDRGFRLACWAVPSRAGVAVVSARLWHIDDETAITVGPQHGSGCDPLREVALLRAVNEAAQARAMFISGARDDIDRSEYGRGETATFTALLDDVEARRAPGAAFDTLPDVDHGDLERDLDWLCQQVAAAGWEDPVLVDLPAPTDDLAVLRVVVPGTRSRSARWRQRTTDTPRG